MAEIDEENEEKKDFFWPSYVDVMTNLFAVMLVLFVVSYIGFHGINKTLSAQNEELAEYRDRYKEITAIYKLVQNIDGQYFSYDSANVKFILNVVVNYPKGEFTISSIEQQSQQQEIIKAGHAIQNMINTLQSNELITDNVKYLVVIEGQASKDNYYIDNYHNNDVLSYQRAWKLNEFWEQNGIRFREIDGCELLISGSGEHGIPRETTEQDNQRFLIHIVPVIGNLHLEKIREI